MPETKNPLQISVYDHTNRSIVNAKVSVKSLAARNAKALPLTLDKASGAYRLNGAAPGPYLASVAAAGFESQDREIQISPGGTREIFILGTKGLPVLYRGKVQVPF